MLIVTEVLTKVLSVFFYMVLLILAYNFGLDASFQNPFRNEFPVAVYRI